jgi:hypothetical protein
MSVTEEQSQRFEFGRVIGRTFSLIGRNFLLFLMLSVLFAGAPGAAMQYLQWEQLRAPGGDEVGWLAFAGILVSMIGGIVLQGALTRASLDDLSGKGAGLSGALAAGFGLILPLIGLGILMTLGQALGLLLLIVPGIYLMLRWAVAAPVLVTWVSAQPIAVRGTSASKSASTLCSALALRR